MPKFESRFAPVISLIHSPTADEYRVLRAADGSGRKRRMRGVIVGIGRNSSSMSTLPALIDRESLAVAEDKDAKVRHGPLSRSLEATTSIFIAFSHLLTIE